MLKHFSKSLLMFARKAVIGSALVLSGMPILATTASAQQLVAQQGDALSVNLIRRAQQMNMRDSHSRALYSYIRTNPTVLDNTEFYVNFLIYLMTTDPNFDCRSAFTNEFERRDYFTQSFSVKEQLRNVVASVQIPQRFDIAHSIDTGGYDFASGNLPFTNIAAIGLRVSLGSSIRAENNAHSCARSILDGTQIGTAVFPWEFEVVNAVGKSEQPSFPFGKSLQLNGIDARQLFERFGRQLYAIVGYQFNSANNGDHKIQVIATDGQLFGLSSDAVVRVKTYAHPTLSQPQYLDITNPMRIEIPEYNIDMNITFQQNGFRAVGVGTRKDPGTNITTGGIFEVGGSAAVGSSAFIMRLATPGLTLNARGLKDIPKAQRYLTLFGALEIERITGTIAPVSGQSVLLQYNPASGELEQSHSVAFTGSFRAATLAGSEAAQESTENQSQLDTTPIAPAVD